MTCSTSLPWSAKKPVFLKLDSASEALANTWQQPADSAWFCTETQPVWFHQCLIPLHRMWSAAHICPQSFSPFETVRFLQTFGAEWLMILAASYFRRELFVLMAFVQIWPQRAEQKRSPLTHGGLRVGSWCGKGEWRRREKRGEKCRLWYWIKPSHFLYPEPELLSTLHIWQWYLHEGKPWAYGSGLVLKFPCINFWEKVWSHSLILVNQIIIIFNETVLPCSGGSLWFHGDCVVMAP